MTVAILTDFGSFDEAYSLCTVVANQVKMLNMLGVRPKLLVRNGFEADLEADIIPLDPGRTGSNRVELDENSGAEIASLTAQMAQALERVEVCISHDLIYQANMWKQHVAARRVARERPGLRWLHAVHSSTNLNTATQTGPYQSELAGRFPNSQLIAFHPEEVNRKGGLYGYEQDQIVILPNAIDFTAHYHPLANEIIERSGAWGSDIVAVYPARLDRGKQPHILVEIFEHLAARGYSATVIIADFHSTGGDKATYREELRAMARAKNVNLFFTSDAQPYHVPNQVIRNLFNFADVFIHPSVSECDPLTLLEAAWHGCALLLNFDLPAFRQWDGLASFGKFSSGIDVNTGLPGQTTTQYANRSGYMRQMAAVVAYQVENNPALAMHRKMRLERSLKAVSRKLWAILRI